LDRSIHGWLTLTSLRVHIATLVGLTVFCASGQSVAALEPGYRVARLGATQEQVLLAVNDGQLTVKSLMGTTLHQSTSDEYVYGYAVGPVLRVREPILVVWFARRDANIEGVVPHDSGWMDYGNSPWVHHHIGIYAFEAEQLSARWMSSALSDPVEALSVEAEASGSELAVVAVQQRGPQERYISRYRFGTFQLELISRASLPPSKGSSSTSAAPDPATLMVDLLFVGDVMLGREVGRRLGRHSYEDAFSDMVPWFANTDLAMGNLEGCFVDQQPQLDEPYALYSLPAQVGALSYLGLSVMSLANNHCNADDMQLSQRLLNAHGIAAVGLSAGPFDRQPSIFLRHGLRIGVLGAMVLPTTAEAVEQLMGSSLQVTLRQASIETDLLIVSIHWGDEYADTPSLAQQRLAHWLIEQGVDIVVGHHSHVVQPVESYKDGLIAYSLGNFVFDQEGYIPEANGLTERGLLLRIRAHKALGLFKDEVATCISNRYQVKRCSF